MINPSPKTHLLSSAAKTAALLTGLALLSGCAATSTTYQTASDAKAMKTKSMAKEMVLAAVTTNEDARALYNAGWSDFENSRNVSAYKKFQDAATADPSFTMANVMAAWTATSTEGFATNTRKASASAGDKEKSTKLLVEMLESYMANDAAGAVAATKKLADAYPKSAHAWNFYGNTQGSINETTDARAAYKMATKLDAEFVPGLVNLGNNYLTQEPKDFTKAEKYFQKAVALTPNEPNPHDLLGDVHRAQNNMKAAYKDYTKAAELAPTLGSGLQQRGHVNSFMGNYAEARADYARAAALEDARGSNAGPNFRVYGAYVNLHEGKPAAAITELQGISDGLIGSSMEGAVDTRTGALLNIAGIAIESGRSETAMKAIKEATEIQIAQADALGSTEFRDDAKATAYYYKGLLAARMGDHEKAAKKAAAFEKQVATVTNPRKLERMHEVLGMSAYHQGDYAKAAKHLAKGDTQANMATKYYLARAHEAAGNKAGAADLYSELAVYNFNGPGYAMFRKDILKRAPKS